MDEKKITADVNYDLGEDYEDEEEIVTLHNEESDKDEDFRVVWYLEMGDKNYVLLNPVEPSDDIAEDEVIICEYGEDEQGEEYILPVENEKTLENVYNQYVKEYEAACAEEESNADNQ